MMRSALEAKHIIDVIMYNPDFKADFGQCFLTPGDWTDFELMVAFLEIPAKLSTFLGADEGYCSISMARISTHLLFEHCGHSMFQENTMLKEAADIIIRHVQDYRSHFNSVPAKIAEFLDPRIPPPPIDSEELVTIKMVISELLEGEYPGPQSDQGLAHEVLSNDHAISFEDALWRLHRH